MLMHSVVSVTAIWIGKQVLLNNLSCIFLHIYRVVSSLVRLGPIFLKVSVCGLMELSFYKF